MTLGLYSQKTAELIHQRVLGDDPDVVHSEGAYDTDYESEWFMVKLTETLLYPDPLETKPEETGQTTATAAVIKYDKTVEEDLDMEEVTDTDEEITIVNRNPLLFAQKGDYLWVRHTEAEFVPVGVVRGEVDAILTSALAAASDPLTGPSTATFKILAMNSSGDLVVTTWEETLTHRYKSITLDDATYITVKRLNGEWRLSGADCGVSGITHTGGDTALLGVQP